MLPLPPNFRNKEQKHSKKAYKNKRNKESIKKAKPGQDLETIKKDLEKAFERRKKPYSNTYFWHYCGVTHYLFFLLASNLIIPLHLRHY